MCAHYSQKFILENLENSRDVLMNKSIAQSVYQFPLSLQKIAMTFGI